MNETMILIVEDEDTTRLALQAALQQKGYVVQVAADGEEALNKLRQYTFQVVLLDLIMPKTKGVEILEQSHLLAPLTAFIVFTAFASTDTAITALRSGAIDYLRKPVSFEAIFGAISKGVAKHQEWVQQKQAMNALEAQTNENDDIVQTKAFIVDRPKQIIYYHDDPLTLTPSEYQLLIVLINYREIVLSYTELVRFTHGVTDVDEDQARKMVKTHLYRLNKKFKELGQSPLQTVRGRGVLLSDE